MRNKHITFKTILIIMLILQIAMIAFALTHAFHGTNATHRLWDGGIDALHGISNMASFGLGIAGLITSKRNVIQIILSIVLIVSTLISLFSWIMVIGAYY